MIRLNRTALILAGLLFLNACAAETEDSGTINASVDFHTVQTLAEKVGNLIEEDDWKGLSKLFSSSSEQEHSASQLKKLFEETAAGSADSVDEAYGFLDGERTAAYVTLSCSDQKIRAVSFVNDDLSIESISFEVIPETAQPESSDTYSEQLVEIGNNPKIHGILTLPKEQESPYLAILMPSGFSDPMNGSGEDSSFRKDLAHELANNNVASIRYDMRLYEDPSWALENKDLSLDRIYFRDLASCIHSIEKYPVDAANIVYIGCGISGTFGYSAVYHHFELSKGLVLLNAPYGTGLQLMAEYYGISDEDEEKAEEAVKQDEGSDELIGDYPLSYWQQWDENNPLTYTPHVAIPIAIFQSEKAKNSGTIEDYDNWRSQKGSNVSMVSYSDTDENLRDADGSLATLAGDIALWMSGEDIEEINKERKEETDPSASPSAED